MDLARIAKRTLTWFQGKEAFGMMRRSSRVAVSLRSLLSSGQWIGSGRDSRDVLVHGCANRVDRVRPGDVFVAVLDDEFDGHDQAQQALELGAVAVVAERLLPIRAPQLLVDDSRLALAEIAQRMAGNPHDHTPMIAIGGTHGKTSVGLLIGQIWEQAGRSVATHTSLSASDGRSAQAAATESPLHVAEWLKRAAEHRVDLAVLEASDRALLRHCHVGLAWDMALVTNMKRPQCNDLKRDAHHQALNANRQSTAARRLPGGECG